MILNIKENILRNLQLLEEVKLDYPMLQEYEDKVIARETIANVGLDNFVRLIDLKGLIESRGMKIYYDRVISYKEVKEMIVKNTDKEKSKSIFLNKSKKKFSEMWMDDKLMKRYKRYGIESHCTGLDIAEPLILHYLQQEGIEVSSSSLFINNEAYFSLLTKPEYYSRELRMTQEFIISFIDYAKSQNLDMRKCNVKSLTSELNNKLKDLMVIPTDSKVRCKNGMFDFTVNKIYTIKGSRVNYSGFLDINLCDDRNSVRWVPYSSFEEVSRQRDDLLNLIGI